MNLYFFYNSKPLATSSSSTNYLALSKQAFINRGALYNICTLIRATQYGRLGEGPVPAFFFADSTGAVQCFSFD